MEKAWRIISDLLSRVYPILYRWSPALCEHFQLWLTWETRKLLWFLRIGGAKWR